MRRVIPLISVCLLLTAAAESAFAQQRLFARTQQEVVELDLRQASLGAVIRRFSLPLEATGTTYQDVVPFGGGEFLAWVVGQRVVLLNTHSGSVQRFTFPDFFPARVIGTDGNSRLVVLGTNLAQHDVVLVADARTASTQFLDLGTAQDLKPVAYAAAANVLFSARARTASNPFLGSDFYDIHVIDATTGAVLKTLDISPVSADFLTTNAAGTPLFATDFRVGTFAFDVVSGARGAANPTLSLGSASLLDEHRNRVLLGWPGIEAYAADSLQFLGTISVPFPLPPPGQTSRTTGTRDLDVSGLSATAFLLQGVQGLTRGGDYCQSRLTALDVDTGRVRQTVDTTDSLGCAATDLVRVTEPAAPQSFTADVAGNQVALKWQAPFGATRYELEAGLAPGLANLARITVDDTQLTVDGVPPGEYHLRVRAINTIGKSGASQEIQLIVP